MARKVTTNNVPRDIIDGSQLTPKERERFDYLNRPAIEDGCGSASFFRYRGELYDLSEFTRFHEALEGPRMPSDLAVWDGCMSDSAFSATVVRYVTDDMGDTRVVVGYVTS